MELLLFAECHLEHSRATVAHVDVGIQLLLSAYCNVGGQIIGFGAGLLKELGEVPGEFEAAVVEGEVISQLDKVRQRVERFVVAEVARISLELLEVLFVEEEVDHHPVLGARVEVVEVHLLHLLTCWIIVQRFLDLLDGVGALLQDGDGDRLGTDRSLQLHQGGGCTGPGPMNFTCHR